MKKIITNIIKRLKRKEEGELQARYRKALRAYNISERKFKKAQDEMAWAQECDYDDLLKMLKAWGTTSDRYEYCIKEMSRLGTQADFARKELLAYEKEIEAHELEFGIELEEKEKAIWQIEKEEEKYLYEKNNIFFKFMLPLGKLVL